MIVFAVSRVFNDMALSPQNEVLTLREQNAQLLADNTHLKAQLQEVLTLVGQLRGTIEKQQDHIAKLVKMTFGRKSERVEGPTLFDDLPDEPATPPASPVIAEPEVLVPKRKGHGRKPNPATLPRQREEIDLSDAEKVCPCCSEVRVRIGETIRERLDYTPSSIFVLEMAQQTYACRSCEKAARDAQIAAATFPPEPVPRSGVGAGLLAQVIVSKYVDHCVQGEAVHEMRVGLSRSGCRIRSQTAEELRRLRAVVGSVFGNGVA
ncbi:MAG: IS66 family transposase zinc-finger binding domain-containing protein [Planctomycetes bacterium]|nr:IS66 family transposase zinc-finger binding domain-containing protein [Planctomycetota bacterium]